MIKKNDLMSPPNLLSLRYTMKLNHSSTDKPKHIRWALCRCSDLIEETCMGILPEETSIQLHYVNGCQCQDCETFGCERVRQLRQHGSPQLQNETLPVKIHRITSCKYGEGF